MPDHLGSPLPPKLLATLQSLPRLLHLHLTTSSNPQRLAALSCLTALRTLSVSYTGPPAMPPGLLAQLQQGLGAYCRVQLWEQVVMQQQGSFGDAAAAEAAAAGDGAAEGAAAGDGAAVAGAAGGEGAGEAEPEAVAAAAAQPAGAVDPATAVDLLDAAAGAGEAASGRLALSQGRHGLMPAPQSAAAGRQRRGLVRRGVRWLRVSRLGRVLRAVSGGLLVFETGRQLGLMAGRLSR